MVGLGDAAEDVVAHDGAAESDIPGIERGRRRRLERLSTAYPPRKPSPRSSQAPLRQNQFLHDDPHHISKISPIPTPPGTSDNRLQPNSERNGNLDRAAHRGKQKRRASADFLGVMAVSRKLSAGVAFRQQSWLVVNCRLELFRLPSPEQAARWPGDGPAKSNRLVGAGIRAGRSDT